MQSHASRHVVPEFLQDRHPPLPTAWQQTPAGPEIAEAFGRRAIPKLLAVLALPTAGPADRVAALRVLNSLLPSQEAKAEALAAGAAGTLVASLLGVAGADGSTASVAGASDEEVSQQALCCSAIEALALLRQGREALAASAGIEALAAPLGPVPAPALAALKAFAASSDGATLLRNCPAGVEAAVVAALDRPATPLAACRDALAVLAATASTEGGVHAACGAQVPAAAVAMARRALRVDLGAGGEPLEVVREACGCLRSLCRTLDGKTQVRVASGIEVLAAALKAPGADDDLRRLAASVLASLAVDAAAKMAVMVHAGASMVALLKAGPSEAGHAEAAAALRLVLEDLGARRKLEGQLTPGETARWLGRLPDTPPSHRYVVEAPAR